MVFPRQNLPLPRRPFPFDLSAQVLPRKWVPDCHLVRTVIPCLPNYDSLGVFHCKMFRFLASFASMVSRGDNRRCLYTASICLFLFPHMLTQGRLHCTQQRDSAHRLAGSYQARTRVGPELSGTYHRRTTPGLHGNRVVYSMPLECARNP